MTTFKGLLLIASLSLFLLVSEAGLCSKYCPKICPIGKCKKICSVLCSPVYDQKDFSDELKNMQDENQF